MKRAIETARYVIPIGAFTSMVHTVSGIVLHRLQRMMHTGDAPYEARMVISEMLRQVREWDPLFFEKVGAGIIEPADVTEATFPKPRGGGDAYAAQFDARLDGRWSRLRDASPDAEEIVAESVRSVFGLTAEEMSDDEALDRVMNPARNRYRLDILNVSYHSPLMRALHHATYVFEKRLSHTADSQDQRHRMVPASRPLLTFADTARPDFITPRLIAANPRAKAVYDEAMADAWAAKNRLLALGVPLEFALYVLPNAKTLRFVESGSLLALLHKWTLRTCFNAQEEIYLASMDELEQVRSAHPRIGRHIGPPCVIRNGLISPRCTEGSHFCGVPVWKDFPAAVRRLVTGPRPWRGWSISTPPAASSSRFSRPGPPSTTTSAPPSCTCSPRWSWTPPTGCWRARRASPSGCRGSAARSSTTWWTTSPTCSCRR